MINLGRIPAIALDGGLELMSATEQTFVDAIKVAVNVVAVLVDVAVLTGVTLVDVLAVLDVLPVLDVRSVLGVVTDAVLASVVLAPVVLYDLLELVSGAVATDHAVVADAVLAVYDVAVAVIVVAIILSTRGLRLA